MLYIDPKMISKALDILNNSKDLLDEKADIAIIDNILNDYSLGIMYERDYLVSLDKQFQDKYVAAKTLRILEKTTNWKQQTNIAPKYVLSIPEIEALKCDRFGIFIHVLKSAHEIVDDADILDKSMIKSME